MKKAALFPTLLVGFAASALAQTDIAAIESKSDVSGPITEEATDLRSVEID